MKQNMKVYYYNNKNYRKEVKIKLYYIILYNFTLFIHIHINILCKDLENFITELKYFFIFEL